MLYSSSKSQEQRPEAQAGQLWRTAKDDPEKLSMWCYWKDLPAGVASNCTPPLKMEHGSRGVYQGMYYKVRQGRLGDFLVYKKPAMFPDIIPKGHDKDSIEMLPSPNPEGEDFKLELAAALAKENHYLREANQNLNKKLRPFTAPAEIKIGDKTYKVKVEVKPWPKLVDIVVVTEDSSGKSS